MGCPSCGQFLVGLCNAKKKKAGIQREMERDRDRGAERGRERTVERSGERRG